MHSTPKNYRQTHYSSSFLFSCLASPLAASVTMTRRIQAPHLWLNRPPVQKPLIGVFERSVYHIEKEFDEEGESNGVGGINAYHFGARMYDPVIGMWMSVDKAGQFWNMYRYTTNPILYTDPDGNAEIKRVYHPKIHASGQPYRTPTGQIAYDPDTYKITVKTLEEWIAGYTPAGALYSLRDVVLKGDMESAVKLLAGLGLGHMAEGAANAYELLDLMSEIHSDLNKTGLWDASKVVAVFEKKYRTHWYEFWKPKPEFETVEAAEQTFWKLMKEAGIEDAWIEGP